MTASDDLKGRRWVVAEWEAPPNELKQSLCVLFSGGDEGTLRILGHGVIVYSSGSNEALCLGAAHSFEAVKVLQQQRTRTRLPAWLQEPGVEYISSDEIKAATLVNGKLINCDVGTASYQGDYDVAAFTISSKDEHNFEYCVALDLAPPNIGEEVVVLANSITLEQGEPGKATIGLNCQMRLGIVTEIVQNASYLPGQSFYFKTSIPVTAGMSGAPVLRKPTPGAPLVVLGLVSSDISTAESHESYLSPGDSTHSLLWPAMGLSVAVVDAGFHRNIVLAELSSRSLIDDRTENAFVETRVNENEKMEVVFHDLRSEPSSHYHLNMPTHPDLAVGYVTATKRTISTATIKSPPKWRRAFSRLFR